MQKQKLVKQKQQLIIKNNTKDKVNKMGQSAKKRVEFSSKPKNKENQSKHSKRMTENLSILNKLTQQ